MKKIPLTKNKFALVDDDDFDDISSVKWYASLNNGIWYAKRSIKENKKQVRIYMHRVVIKCDKCYSRYSEVDHINGNGLDNRKKNLRLCTHSENLHNSRLKNVSTSKYRGVCFDSPRKMWKSQIQVNGKNHFLGRFRTELEANEMCISVRRKLRLTIK